MTTFKIEISGMHCTGCKNLITMSLEEASMKRIIVEEKVGTVEFDSDLQTVDVRKALDTVFAELPEYTYTNLQRKEIV